ncbi:hypothetical protein [Nocardia asiatica]|uniref:hypothetical protein n=1 Tax=Nocardia asiatica TaxID=209252 RepID=UPI002453B03D|nr:hypothetical protein [Nocardia asiatica]
MFTLRTMTGLMFAVQVGVDNALLTHMTGQPVGACVLAGITAGAGALSWFNDNVDKDD